MPVFVLSQAIHSRHISSRTATYMYISSKQSYFSHPLVRLKTGPRPVPKQVSHRMRSSASPFNLHYPLVSLSHSVIAYFFFPVFLSRPSFSVSFNNVS